MKDGEIDFLRAYKDFIYYFNMLERNIGYCLRYCLMSLGNKNPEKWLTASFDSKLKKIICLAKNLGVESQFSAWHLDVKKCRKLRNIISHGHWEWMEHLDKPIRYHSPEIEDAKGAFTTKEFALQLCFLKEVSDEFAKIRSILEVECNKEPNQPSEVFRQAEK